MGAGISKINQRLATSVENFSKKGGEKISNYVNAAGKAIIAPMVIMANPFSKEEKENKEWAAIKQPVEAVITLGMQLLSLALIYKGMNKLIQKSNFTFEYVKKAIKDPSQIPDTIMKACNNDKEKTLNMYRKQYNDIFKDRIGAVASALVYLPVLAVSNRIYPKIAKKLFNKDENKSVK